LPIIHHHSLNLPELASILSESIHEEQKSHPLKSPTVIIPNLNIERWLKIHLPRYANSKISLNVNFVFLEKFFEKILSSNQQLPVPRNNLYKHAEIERLIFQYLTDNQSDPSFSFLGNYLTSASRVFSLSIKLANYFKDYELNRSSWINFWGKDCGVELPLLSSSPLAEESETSPYFQFQKKIYTELFLKTNQDKYSLSQLLIRSIPTLEKNPQLKDGTLHLFCLANLSDSYFSALKQLSNQSNLDLRVYQFHTGESNVQVSNHTSAARWSLPQAYMASVLSTFSKKRGQVSKTKSVAHPIPDSLATLHQFLKGEAITKPLQLIENYSCSVDGGLRIWNAPSIYREVECVANDILYKLNESKEIGSELSLLDFCILVTDIQSYRGAIEWVFDGGILLETDAAEENQLLREKLPYSLVDIKASDISPLYRTLCDFWEICNPSGFKFTQFERILRSPLVNMDPNQDGDYSEAYDAILSSLGVAYEDSDMLASDDPFQISNGIRRAVLSTIISNENSERFDFAFAQVNDEEALSHLTDIWCKLLFARKLARELLSQSEWTEQSLENLKDALESLFQFDTADLNIRSHFFSFWNQLSNWKGLRLDSQDGLEIIQLITDEAFESISVKKGDYLTGGVTISLLQPMRPLPFKHVYILGLGEGKFPGISDRSKLNLRQSFPEAWDLNRKQIQESLFWESLFSANESLTLSYVGQNTKEDKVFEPCSTLFEIIQGLEIKNITILPLVSYSKVYSHSKEACKAGLVSYDFSRIWFRSEETSPHLTRSFQNIETLPKLTQPTYGKKKIYISDLIAFLKDPLDSYLKKQLGMYITEEEESISEEIFYLDHLQRSQIQKEVYAQIFPELTKSTESWNRKKIESILDPIIETKRKSAQFPNFVYSKLERESILDHFEGQENLLLEWQELLKGARYSRYISFGDTGLNSSTCIKKPALTFDGLPNVLVMGEWEHIFQKGDQYFHIYTKSLEHSPQAQSDFGGGKFIDYFGKLTSAFLTALAFKKQNLNLKILTTNHKDSKKVFYPELPFEIENAEREISSYFQSLIELYVSDQPTFFPRIAYLNFYVQNFSEQSDQSKKQKSEKTKPILAPDMLLDFENEWRAYLQEKKETVHSNLTPLSRLYPKIEDYLVQSNIQFANQFYAPMSYWRSL